MISIVVPCFNEEKNISRLVERFVSVVEQIKGEQVELVLVNNGSQDNTSKEIDVAVDKHNFIKKVDVAKNQGYGYGILKGLEACQGEWLGWIHADLQLPPEAFLEFEKIISDNRENANGFYFKGRRKNRPLSDRFFTGCMGVFETIYLGVKLWDINAQPTLIHRDLYKIALNPPHDFSLDLYFYYLSKKNKCKEIRIPVVQQDRVEGVSSWNSGRLSDRTKLIKRTFSYSKKLKKDLRDL